jgi:DNA-binding LacI/PurR family transcriptional regulator
VVQPAQEIGRAGFEHLVARIERGVAPRRLNLPYELHLGESLGPPRPESI